MRKFYEVKEEFKRISGERLDDVILRIIKFKAKGKRIYVYTKEEDKK